MKLGRTSRFPIRSIRLADSCRLFRFCHVARAIGTRPPAGSSRGSASLKARTYPHAHEAVEGQTCLANQPSPRPQRSRLQARTTWPQAQTPRTDRPLRVHPVGAQVCKLERTPRVRSGRGTDLFNKPTLTETATFTPISPHDVAASPNPAHEPPPTGSSRGSASLKARTNHHAHEAVEGLTCLANQPHRDRNGSHSQARTL